MADGGDESGLQTTPTKQFGLKERFLKKKAENSSPKDHTAKPNPASLPLLTASPRSPSSTTPTPPLSSPISNSPTHTPESNARQKPFSHFSPESRTGSFFSMVFDKEGDLVQTSPSINDTTSSRELQLQHELMATKRKNTELQNQLRDLQDRLASSTASNKELSAQLYGIQATVRRLQQQEAETSELLSQKDAEIRRIRHTADSTAHAAAERLASATEEIRKLSTQRASAEKKIAELISELATESEHTKIATNRITEQAQTIDSLKTQLETLRQAARGEQTARFESECVLSDQATQWEHDVKNLRANCEKLQDYITQLLSAVDSAHDDAASVRSDLQSVKEQHERERLVWLAEREQILTQHAHERSQWEYELDVLRTHITRTRTLTDNSASLAAELDTKWRIKYSQVSEMQSEKEEELSSARQHLENARTQLADLERQCSFEAQKHRQAVEALQCSLQSVTEERNRLCVDVDRLTSLLATSESSLKEREQRLQALEASHTAKRRELLERVDTAERQYRETEHVLGVHLQMIAHLETEQETLTKQLRQQREQYELLLAQVQSGDVVVVTKSRSRANSVEENPLENDPTVIRDLDTGKVYKHEEVQDSGVVVTTKSAKSGVASLLGIKWGVKAAAKK